MSSMSRYFAAAPWPKTLSFMSAGATVLLCGLGYAAYRTIPTLARFTHRFGAGIALVFPAILVFSLLFMVRGYFLDRDLLSVQRLLWRTRVPLDGLRRVLVTAGACKGSIRVMGNGGLFAFTGLYQNKEIGRYRLFGTDLSRSVVLVLQTRTVVVTPATPDDFIEHLRRLFPHADVTREARNS